MAAIVLALAFALRFAASLDDFWLDEIWTWGLVQARIKSAWDVLLALKHENNHFLNTWWIFFLGPDADRIWYRLPAVILGSLTVLLARQAVADSGPVAVRAVSILTVPSYLLVHYSSEARGYAYQLFFSVAAYVLLQRLLRNEQTAGSLTNFRDGTSRRDRWLFGACCVLGCLGHPAFLMMYLALGGWAMFAAFRSAKSWSIAVRWLLGVFLGPTILLGILYVLNLSQLENGGGPQENPWIIAVATFSLMVGGPEFGDWSLLVGSLAAIAVVAQLILMKRDGDDRWVCWILMILIPAALIAVTGRKEVYPRYFLGTVILLDLALAQLAAHVCRVRYADQNAKDSHNPFAQRTLPRIAVILFLAATLIGNGIQLCRLFRFGRGHGQAVVEFLRDETPAGPISIGSDPPPFRHALLLDYFGRRLGLQPRLMYFGAGPWPESPQWILLHSQDHEAAFEPTIADPRGRRYELRRVFRFAGLSGWHTAVYELTQPAGTKP